MATKKKTTKKSSSKKTTAARKKSKKKAGVGLAPAGFLLVNMIPNSLSGETNQDSEPHLTVNPANALQIIGTAFSPNPGGGHRAPVYASTNGGDTWRVNGIVPSVAGSTIGTSDITTSFNR